MIQNDEELMARQERIAWFQGTLAQLCVTASPEEFPSVAGGYRAAIVRRQDEVLECLTRHATGGVPLRLTGGVDQPGELLQGTK